MATHDYDIGNGSGLDVRTDLNAVLSAILSQNSSATEPPVTMAGMLWYDTANSLLKQRNNSNDGWETKWDTTKGQLATLASPTFTGNVALPLTTLLNGKSIAITDAPTFTGTASFANITASGTISLPAATSIGAVSATELSYLDGVTSAIETQLNARAQLAGATFTGNIIVPTATSSNHAVNKTQMDTAISTAISAIPTTTTIASIESYTVGSYIEFSSVGEVNTASASYVQAKEVKVARSGTVTVYFGLRSQNTANTTYGIIYKNGVEVGTPRYTTSTSTVYFTEDISVSRGDLIQLYCHRSNVAYYSYVNTFQIRVGNSLVSTSKSL